MAKISFELAKKTSPHPLFVCVTKMYSPNLNCSSALEVMCLSGFPRRHSGGDFGGFLIFARKKNGQLSSFFLKSFRKAQETFDRSVVLLEVVFESIRL